MTVVLSSTGKVQPPREDTRHVENGRWSFVHPRPSSQAVQTPEQAAEALRQFGEAQHSHSEVIESLAGQADEVDDDEDESLGVCNAEEVLQAYARCRESETLKTYRSAVTAFTNWLARVKDNHEVKAMNAKILKCIVEALTLWITWRLPSRSKGQPTRIVGLLCR